jgi:hypothetical protein
MRVADLRRDGK